MGVAVDEARDHAPAARVEALVGRHAGRLDGGDAAVLDHQRSVANDPERALAERRVGGHQQADPVDRLGGHA